MGDIKDIIRIHEPSVLFVHELNLNIYQLQNIVNIPGYKFEVDNLLEINRKARMGCWINRDLVYERIKELEDDRNQIVAIQIGFPNMKRINAIGYYIQFQSTNMNEIKDNKRELQEFTNICTKIGKLIEEKMM